MTSKIPIEIVEMEGQSYHLFIKGLINNIQECELIIDTGASKTVFDKTLLHSFAEKITTHEEMHSAAVNAGTIETQMALINNFNIGTVEIKDFSTVLIDLSHVNLLYEKLLNKKIWGLIGSDFLLSHNAIIDYSKKELTLKFHKPRKRK